MINYTQPQSQISCSKCMKPAPEISRTTRIWHNQTVTDITYECPNQHQITTTLNDQGFLL